MNPKQLYLYAIDEATRVVEVVQADMFELPTPDTEWSVYDLLQHMVYELAWTADVVAGKTIAEVGDKYEGNLLDGTPLQAWRHYGALTREAVELCDERATAHLSYTNKPVGDYLLEAGNDELVHAWDLGQAISVPVVFDEQVAQILYKQALNRQAELVKSGLFAPPLPVGDDANTQTKLLALLGRSETWATNSNS